MKFAPPIPARFSLFGTNSGALTACATTDETQPQVVMAAAAAKPESVSVFGIFRNGRISPEAWEDFGKALSTPFSEGLCEAAYDVVFADAYPELATVIDDYAKENGVSDELLEKFAPLAAVNGNTKSTHAEETFWPVAGATMRLGSSSPSN
jgi:hypothetical protein